MLLTSPSSPSESQQASLLPLILDLDGTLIHTDTFHEMMVVLLLTKPWVLLFLPFWFIKGRAFTKARLAEYCSLSPTHLPYNTQLLDFAKEELKKGRPLILATGTDQHVAMGIAEHLGIFQDVIGSNGKVNMTGLHKQQALLNKFGYQGFDYAGDSCSDVHIWQVARAAIVVCPKRGVLQRAQALENAKDLLHFPRIKSRLLALCLTLRPLFWVCNALVSSWTHAIAFSLLVSGLFIGGDLLFLSKERAWPFRKSIFAEGHLHLITAMSLAPFLIILSLVLIIPSPSLSPCFFLFYIPLFMGLDLFTRSTFQPLRWAFLSAFQFLSLFLSGAIAL